MGKQFHGMYGAQWQEARKVFLREHPVCAMCGKPAEVVDHIEPHKGDWSLFWNQSNWQSLCKKCHDAHKHRIENGGILGGWNDAGLPTDPRHPWNQMEVK